MINLTEYSYCPIRRNSYDNELNSHGKRLLDICRSADLKIFNGRVSGDTLLRATFHGRNGIVSVVDYTICDQETLSNVANFVVKQPCSLSEHSSIITWPNINTNICELEPSRESNRPSRLPIHISLGKGFRAKIQRYLTLSRSTNPHTRTEYIDDDTPIQDVNTTLEKVENILIIAAKKCLKIKTGKKRRRIKPMSNKKWFDKECRFKKNELRKLSNQKHRDPLNANLREKYHVVLTEYKKLLCRKTN